MLDERVKVTISLGGTRDEPLTHLPNIKPQLLDVGCVLWAQQTFGISAFATRADNNFVLGEGRCSAVVVGIAA